MKYKIECEQQEDGRWLADVSALPGVMAYGATAEEARAVVEALATTYADEDQADDY
jgi:predicted RNase H-like HicB family nuclease